MTIQLQFSTSTEMSSAIIRRVSHSPFSHVDVVMDWGDSLLGASNSPKAPITEGNASGVALRPKDYQVFGIRRIARIAVPPAAETKFYELVHSQLGKPFDDGALYAFLSPDVSVERDWREADKWFCSELVTWALEQAGAWPYEILVSKNRVSPADLLLMVNPLVANAKTFWSSGS